MINYKLSSTYFGMQFVPHAQVGYMIYRNQFARWRNVLKLLYLKLEKCVILCTPVNMRATWTVVEKYIYTYIQYRKSHNDMRFSLAINVSNMLLVDVLLLARNRFSNCGLRRKSISSALIRSFAVPRCSTIYYCVTSANEITVQSTFA